MTPTGSEHHANFNGKSAILESGGAQFGALSGQNAPKPSLADADLQAVINAWQALNHHQRRQVRALMESMVKARRTG